MAATLFCEYHWSGPSFVTVACSNVAHVSESYGVRKMLARNSNLCMNRHTQRCMGRTP